MLIEGFSELDEGIAIVVRAVEGRTVWWTSFEHQHGNWRKACARSRDCIPGARRWNASIQALTYLVDHRGLACATGTKDEHVGESSMLADRTHDGAVGLLKQAMGDRTLPGPGFLLFWLQGKKPGLRQPPLPPAFLCRTTPPPYVRFASIEAF